jgi:hypothetical protein
LLSVLVQFSFPHLLTFLDDGDDFAFSKRPENAFKLSLGPKTQSSELFLSHLFFLSLSSLLHFDADTDPDCVLALAHSRQKNTENCSLLASLSHSSCLLKWSAESEPGF